MLQGWGGPALLDSYELERRAGTRVRDGRGGRKPCAAPKHMWREGLDDDGAEGGRLRAASRREIKAAKIREFNTLGVVLGYRYERLADRRRRRQRAAGRATSRTTCLRRIPAALRRMRGSHDGSSLYDHFGTGFTLLVTDGAAPSVNTRVPLKVLREPSVRDLYQARHALIRPDQHVAWRGDALSSDIFDRITGRASAPAREAVAQSGTGT